MAKEEARKGPWSEEEDVQLALYVNMFGDRRWDFIAKVSGLKRTGKSCRLRWVNYLQPGLKRGKMTPHEECLILELHSKWGNRWSKIAQKLPGRTDNEIKNYWRTQMRKKAQEGKKAKSPSSSSTSSISSICISPRAEVLPASESMDCGFYDTGGVGLAATPGDKDIGLEAEESNKVNSMDDVWKEFEFSEESGSLTTCHAMASPLWNCCPSDSLWSMDEEESKMLMQPMGDPFNYFFPFHNYYMTG